MLRSPARIKQATGNWRVAAFLTIGALTALAHGADIIQIGGAAEAPLSVHDAAVASTTLYLAAWGQGLWIYDIRDVENPVYRGQLATDGRATNLQIVGARLYLFTQSALEILDLNDGGMPARLGSCAISNDYARAVVAGTRAYIPRMQYPIGGERSIQVVDLSDPAKPQLLATWPFHASAVAIAGHYLYTDEGGLRIIDLSDPDNPRPRGQLGGFEAHDIKVEGNLAFLATNYFTPLGGSRYVIDGQIPTTPTISYNGLAIADVSDPDAPRLIGHEGPWGQAGWGIAAAGDLAFMVKGAAGIEFYDAHDPAAPRGVYRQALPGFATHVTVHNGLLLAAAQQGGLFIFRYASFLDPRAAAREWLRYD